MARGRGIITRLASFPHVVCRPRRVQRPAGHMTSWITSWLPEIPSPNFALPTSSIQQRFISFVLKKSLGHFLKPGQLDAHQIESQIGSGYVHVNDLELDNEVRCLQASAVTVLN